MPGLDRASPSYIAVPLIDVWPRLTCQRKPVVGSMPTLRCLTVQSRLSVTSNVVCDAVAMP